MSKLTIIGDVHGKYREYSKLLESLKGTPTVQLGDMGVGFPLKHGDPQHALKMGVNDHFFPGNHDNRDECELNPQCLGKFGMRSLGGFDFFFVSGAWSIDYRMRIPGISWWWNEELSMEELGWAIEAYEAAKPRIIITHDCPSSVQKLILADILGYPTEPFPTRTTRALQMMLEAHQPDLWVFGHYHVKWEKEIGKTKFVCVPELGTLELSREDS